LNQVKMGSSFSSDRLRNRWNLRSNNSNTTNDTVSKNIGLNQFLTRVYNTTGLSVLGALGTSYTVLSVPALSAMMGPLAVGGMVASLVGLISTSFMKTSYIR